MKIEHVRNAIDVQVNVMEEIVKNNGGATRYLSTNAGRNE